MSVVSFALALPVVLLFVAMLAYLLARALLLVGPPGTTGIGRRGGGTPSQRTTLAAAMRVAAGGARSCPWCRVWTRRPVACRRSATSQTRHRPTVACSCLLTIARPGQGKTHGEPPAREPALRKGCSWS